MNLKYTLVTGAGSGIGRATAIKLAADGARVALVGRRNAALEETQRMIEGSTSVFPCDISDPGEVATLIDAVTAEFGRLDTLVNCAAVTAPGALPHIKAEVAVQLWRTNVLGPLLLTQACSPMLAAASQSGDAAVVNVTTSIGTRAWPGSGVYAATKAALESLTRTWAVELADQGIRVNAVAPGAVETPMAQNSGASPDQIEHLRQWQRDHTPLGRVAQAEEIAAVVAFLASPEAGFVTGAVLPVDGGAIVA